MGPRYCYKRITEKKYEEKVKMFCVKVSTNQHFKSYVCLRQRTHMRDTSITTMNVYGINS